MNPVFTFIAGFLLGVFFSLVFKPSLRRARLIFRVEPAEEQTKGA